MQVPETRLMEELFRLTLCCNVTIRLFSSLSPSSSHFTSTNRSISLYFAYVHSVILKLCLHNGDFPTLSPNSSRRQIAHILDS